MRDWEELADAVDIVQRLHEAVIASERPPPGFRAREAPASAAVAGAADLDDVLMRRTAVHAFSERPVELAAVRALAVAGLRADAELFPHCGEAGDRIGLHLVAWRVRGLDPAVHRWQVDKWTPTAAAPTPSDARALVLQTEFVEAPCLLLITGGIVASADRAGAAGYRDLLLRAGAVADTMWLEAVRLGLGACIFAGVVGPAARGLIGAADTLERQLLALAVGFEADGGRPDGVHDA